MINELSIVFPLFNEEKRLRETFLGIAKFKKKVRKKKIEIIFVDDGSTDNSDLLINKFISKESSKNFLAIIFSS